LKHLVIGGVRSGKSAYAEQQLAQWMHSFPEAKALYIASSLAIGEETQARIAKHQAQRDDKLLTCELDYAQHTLSRVLSEHCDAQSLILIECLSTWVGWYLSQNKALNACIDDYEQVKAQFIEQLTLFPGRVIIVTGEVGCGLIGETKLMRVYADKLGELNQQIAALADNVTLVTAGIAQIIKS